MAVYTKYKTQKTENKKNEKKKYAYIPVLKQREIDMKFHYYKEDGTLGIRGDYKLIRSIQELKEFAEKCKGRMIAVDTETTGLSFYQDYIVGFSISLDEYSGIYCPIRHQIKRTETTEQQVLDEFNNPVFLKSGKPKIKKIKNDTFFEQPLNINDRVALDILYEIMSNATISLLHNSMFDLCMLRAEGYDITKIKTFDTMVLPYIYDAENNKCAGLKLITSRLGRKVPEFKDALGGEDNFRYTNPELSYAYASYDTANTFNVYKVMYPLVSHLLKQNTGKVIKQKGQPYNVVQKDNALIRAFADYYGHAKLIVDRQVALDYQDLIERELRELSEKVYLFFEQGPFNLNSGSKEFKSAMAKKCIDTGHKTETGNISFGKDGVKELAKNLKNLRSIWERPSSITFLNSKLDKRATTEGFVLSKIIEKYGANYCNFKDGTNFMTIKSLDNESLTKEQLTVILGRMLKYEKEKLEVLTLIQKVSKLNKAKSSYICKLVEVDECIINYRLQGTASGRLSSGNGSNTKKRNNYYIGLNAQNFTKPEPAFYRCERSNEEGNILGYKFTQVTDDFYREHSEDKEAYFFVEGATPTANIRKCIKAPKGRYVLSLDYSAQELKMMSNLSRDSKMLDAFMHGKDLHKETAISIWGKDKYDKHKRRMAKVCVGDNSLITTQRGIVLSKDLLKTDKLISIDGELQNFVDVQEYGDLIEIEWSNGLVGSYTPNHRIKVWDGKEIVWKEVQNLDTEDQIITTLETPNIKMSANILDYTSSIIRKNKNTTTKFNINCKEFAYLAGLYLGDGNIGKYSKSKGLKMQGKPLYVTYCVEPESIEKVTEYLNTMGINTRVPKLIGKNKTIYRLNANNVAWANIIEDVLGSRKGKNIPDWIYSSWDKETLSNLLAGLLDSDGHLQSKNTIHYTTTSEKLMRGISKLCAILGIQTTNKVSSSILNGKKYKYYDISLFNMRMDVPQLNTRKIPMYSGKSLSGSWKVDRQNLLKIYDEFNNGEVKKGSGKIKEVFWNLKAGNSSVYTQNIIKIFEDYGYDFPLKSYMGCVYVKNKKNIEGNIHVIETEKHTYFADFTYSHNCNFLMAYGGTAFTLANDLEIPYQEAMQITEGHEETYFELYQWKRNEVEKMYKNKGVAYTVFGRPRQFSTRIRQADSLGEEKETLRMIRAVERRVPNHLIQGSCGDVLRSVMLKLYKVFFKNRDPHIDFMTTVHDEINYSVDKEYLVEYARKVEDIMTFSALKPLTINTSIDVGDDLGSCFPFEWKDAERTELVPKRA